MLKKYVVFKHAPSTQILPFKTGLEQKHSEDSFQSRQLQSNALLDYGAEIQLLIQANGQHRVAVHKLISDCLRRAACQRVDDTQISAETQLLQSLRQQSRDLGAEFVVLQKQFATVQSQFLQIVKSQRNRMLAPAIGTPVCSSTRSSGVHWLSDSQPEQRETHLSEETKTRADRKFDSCVLAFTRRRMC